MQVRYLKISILIVQINYVIFVNIEPNKKISEKIMVNLPH